MKSLAHPEWPYVGTPHEWRGFAEKAKAIETEKQRFEEYQAVYQKQNFGPNLP